MKKYILSIDAFVVWCPTWSKHLGRSRSFNHVRDLSTVIWASDYQSMRTYGRNQENFSGVSILRHFSSIETSRSPKGGGEANLPPGGALCFSNFYVTSLSSIIKRNWKLKVFRRGIEPGSSGWKARLITIRPRWLDEGKKSFDLFKLHTFNS